jgi:hypothetical protein
MNRYEIDFLKMSSDCESTETLRESFNTNYDDEASTYAEGRLEKLKGEGYYDFVLYRKLK